MKRNIFQKNNGFTLVELLTAVSVFLVIMTISMGSIIGLFDTNRKSQSMKTVMDNLNFAVESMSREMRFGRNYHCGSGGTPTVPLNCPNPGDSQVSFLSSDGLVITYKLNGTQIEKQVGLSGDFIAVTAPEVVIENLTFYVIGAPVGDGFQPKTLITIRGKAGAKSNTTSEFSVQALVSQRALDL